jgi:hypothetical protein
MREVTKRDYCSLLGMKFWAVPKLRKSCAKRTQKFGPCFAF